MAIGPLAGVLPWQNRNEEETRDRKFGEYFGFVRDRNDPVKAGRVRVYVPSIMSTEDDEDHWLDWCYPKSAGLVVPPVGAPVVVTFEQGYVQHGVYQWGWIQGETAADSTTHKAGKGELDETWINKLDVSAAGQGPALSMTFPKDSARDTLPKYPFNKVYQSESGQVIELDDTPGNPRARFYHPSGLNLLVDVDGSVHVVSKGAMYFRPGGDINFALAQGSSFKVAYPGGSGFQCGAAGFHVTGHAASFLGRSVMQVEKELK